MGAQVPGIAGYWDISIKFQHPISLELPYNQKQVALRATTTHLRVKSSHWTKEK